MNRSTSRIALAATIALAAFGGAAAAQASTGEPATVSVRVEGESQTLLPESTVTTTTTPVVKNGNPSDSCPGTSALGALQLATGGDWEGKWEASFHQYVVESILGESHRFGGGSFWAFYLDHKYSSQGACAAELAAGEPVLFAALPESDSEHPPATLGILAPAEAQVGEAVTVAVSSYAAETGDASPADGATVSYEATGSASTDEQGHATLSFSSTGVQQLLVQAAGAVRTEASVCVHAPGASCSGDGTPGTPGSGTTPRGGVAGYTNTGKPSGPDAITATLSSIRNRHVYRRGHGPRVLAGEVHASLPVASVSLLLRRSYRGRCWAFDGAAASFRRARCGHAGFFKVASGPSFSYLLPERLPAGRYVLEIQASDVAGNRSKLVRGSTEVSFDVA